MTLVSNDPSWWPLIDATRTLSYFIVAASAGVIYDWVLAFGPEVELIWTQHWSLMTGLYLSARYLGIIYAAICIMIYVPTIPVTDTGCHVINLVSLSTITVVNAMLGVIMITRLHAMYQRRAILTFLFVIFLLINIANVVITTMVVRYMSTEELILSGTYQCLVDFGDHDVIGSIYWILTTVWEVVALSFAVWIALKHLWELRRLSAGGIIGDCYTVLMKSHVIYFASFFIVSCFILVYFLTPPADPYTLGSQIYLGFMQISSFVQMFVLGPRLILSIREYHAKLVADPDAATGMASITFQEHMLVSTSAIV